MLTITYIAYHTMIDLLNVRLFLQKVNLLPHLDQEYVSHRILYPFDQYFEEKVLNQSLTIQSIGKADQIRYLLVQEINKHWGVILDQILDKYSEMNINIYQSQHLGDGSNSFFDWIAQNSNINVSYYPFQDSKYDESFIFDELELTQEEKWMLDITQCPSIISSSNQQILFDYAHRYLCVGDPWSCINIDTLLLPHQPKFLERIYEDLGLAYNALQQTYQAEFFIEKWVEISIGANRATALYVYSVILSRYLPKYFKDYKKAFEILPNNAEYLYNYAYVLSFQEKDLKVLDLLDKNNWQLNDKTAWLQFSRSYYLDFLFLYVESLVYCNQIEKTIQMLTDANHRSPNNVQIQQKFKLLKNYVVK